MVAEALCGGGVLLLQAKETLFGYMNKEDYVDISKDNLKFGFEFLLGFSARQWLKAYITIGQALFREPLKSRS